MIRIFLMFLLVTTFAFDALAQKVIKAKDARDYISKTVTVIGKIKSIAGPGILSSMSFYLVTDSVEIGLDVIVPLKIFSKSKMLNEKQKGKIMKVTGLIKFNGEPYTVVQKSSDVEIMN